MCKEAKDRFDKAPARSKPPVLLDESRRYIDCSFIRRQPAFQYLIDLLDVLSQPAFDRDGISPPKRCSPEEILKVLLQSAGRFIRMIEEEVSKRNQQCSVGKQPRYGYTVVAA